MKNTQVHQVFLQQDQSMIQTGSKRNLDLSLPKWFPPQLYPVAPFTTFTASRRWSSPGRDGPLKLLTNFCVYLHRKRRENKDKNEGEGQNKREHSVFSSIVCRTFSLQMTILPVVMSCLGIFR